MKQTFAEKIFGAEKGSIVFAKPDIILSHDNTSSIYSTFKKMGGTTLAKPWSWKMSGGPCRLIF